MNIVDLSHPLVHGAPAFPNDPKLAIIAHGTVATHSYNISQVLMGTHQGTHLDAMFHFFDDGRTLDQMPLDWFYGPARVLRLPKEPNEEITAADLRAHETHLGPEAKILIDTGWHRRFGRPEFFTAFPSLTLDAARYLAARRIRLLGLDIPTPGKQWLELHHILLARDVEIVVVESLANLDALPDTFTFAGFPLNFAGRDGSPIRAVAICAD
jgi:kynurenine formamidase